MTTFVGDIDPGSAGKRPGPHGSRSPVAVLIPPELRLAACARLVADHAPEPQLAARRFIETAADLGIDLSLMWGTLDASGTTVRQVCLAVVGAGRTAMMFLSGDTKRKVSAGKAAEEAAAERVAIVEAACRTLAEPIKGKTRQGVRLAQALLEAHETPVLDALRRAGFRQLGDLAYMRRDPGPLTSVQRARALPAGFRMASVAELTMAGMSSADIDRLLLEILEASYIDTRDCPELCGLREAGDVLESHKAVGRYDPALWWILYEGQSPVGCALFSVSPEHDSLELVYLGLAPIARGRSVGTAFLDAALVKLGESILMSGGVTCAVDTRNTAALRLYQRAGFKRFGIRIPMIRSLASK